MDFNLNKHEMKQIAKLFLVSLVAGAVTLGAYKLFFEKENFRWVESQVETPFLTTSHSPTSAKGAGINEVDFTTAAEKRIHAVVHVRNRTMSKGPSSLADCLYDSDRQRQRLAGAGSGALFSPDGYIVTNNRVIANSYQLQIQLNNNRIYEAEVIRADADSDSALLKVDADGPLPYL